MTKLINLAQAKLAEAESLFREALDIRWGLLKGNRGLVAKGQT